MLTKKFLCMILKNNNIIVMTFLENEVKKIMNRMFQTAMIAGAMATGFMVLNDSKMQKRMNRKINYARKKMMKNFKF